MILDLKVRLASSQLNKLEFVWVCAEKITEWRGGYKKSPSAEGLSDTQYKIRTYDPIRVKDVLYH